MKPLAPSNCTAGFSLVEIVVAIGLISFSLLSLVGLLPVGLNSMKTAQEQAGGANCLAQIATSLRTATVTSGSYQVVGPYSNLSWSEPNTLTNISLGGTPTTTIADQRLAAHVEIKTQPTASSPGEAFISVAWPNRAAWNATTNQWANAQGSISTWLIFSPEK
ncbi:MAG: hypothetical protein ACFUZC_08515 [Chthoniobacteraceae bacterium]